MKHLVFMLEEPSAREMLEGLVPRFLPEGIKLRCIVFEGKQDLEKQLVRKLRGWRVPDTRFVVIRDQDGADCKAVKDRLRVLCDEAGHGDALVRVACRELESFYLGDLAAVESGLNLTGLRRLQGKKKYRAPDRLGNPVHELRQLTNNKYQKLAGSRSIAPHLSLDDNCSRSFQILLTGIRRLLDRWP
jgi:hypothetical protein